MDTNEATIYLAVLITGITLGTIIIYFAISMLRSHRRHFKLLGQTYRAEIEMLEMERTRIARDLHDELGPILAVTQIHINAAEGTTEKSKAHLEKAGRNMNLLHERFGGIARNLTPKALVTKGLYTALKDFFEQYSEVTPILLELHYRLKHELSLYYGLHVYRIMQELVHNAVKHSGATHVKVVVTERKKKLYLFYKDDGKGIRMVKNKIDQAGLGIRNLYNRTEMLGGKLTCTTSEKNGTEYFFEIPITDKNETTHQDINS
jgi:signal transduction histidine kinase